MSRAILGTDILYVCQPVEAIVVYYATLIVSHLRCVTLSRSYYYLRLCGTWFFTFHSASGALVAIAFASASKILQITLLWWNLFCKFLFHSNLTKHSTWFNVFNYPSPKFA